MSPFGRKKKGTDPHAASAELRGCLMEQISETTVSNFFPLERYYEAATKTFDGFQVAFELKQITKAYLLGKRYCHFCVDAIPKHHYYKKSLALGRRHQQQVLKVMDQLEVVVVWMDQAETLRKQREAAERAERQRLFLEESKRKAKLLQQQEAKRLEDIKQRAANVGINSNNNRNNNIGRDRTSVQSSALQKLQMLQAHVSTPQLQSSQTRIPQDPTGERRSSTRFRLDDDSDDDNDEHEFDRLPPPLPPPSISDSALPVAPPSYSEIAVNNNNNDGFLNGDKFMESSNSNLIPLDGMGNPISPRNDSTKKKKKVPMRQLQQDYQRKYQQLVTSGQIRIENLSTYQGRHSGSINGCTVISALVAGHHLRSNTQDISNSQIAQIIDQDCVPVLKAIRGQLGLGNHSLIIPSDVHDYLVDTDPQKLLKQEYFKDVAGGNVMDPQHLGEFIQLLDGGTTTTTDTNDNNNNKPHQKTAATFFFKEHVISICKTVDRSSNTAQFHLIDSMPGGVGSGSGSGGGGSNGTRTTCQNVEAFRVLLHWYCSRKFSVTDCNRLDKTVWDDSMADFDPRVFQGFCWEYQPSK